MFLNHRQETEGGFTLTELLVVILIIGILAAIAIPLFLNQRKAAREAGVKSDLKNVATQVEGNFDTKAQGYKEPVFTNKGTVDGEDPTLENGQFGPLKISEGNSVDFTSLGDKFCLTGSHQDDPENLWYFSSIDGGLSQNFADCTDAGSDNGGATGPVTEANYQCGPLVIAHVEAWRAFDLSRTVEFQEANRAANWTDQDYLDYRAAQDQLNPTRSALYGDNAQYTEYENRLTFAHNNGYYLPHWMALKDYENSMDRVLDPGTGQFINGRDNSLALFDIYAEKTNEYYDSICGSTAVDHGDNYDGDYIGRCHPNTYNYYKAVRDSYFLRMSQDVVEAIYRDDRGNATNADRTLIQTWYTANDMVDYRETLMYDNDESYENYDNLYSRTTETRNQLRAAEAKWEDFYYGDDPAHNADGTLADPAAYNAAYEQFKLDMTAHDELLCSDTAA